MANPLSEVYEALWAAVDTHPVLTTIREANRIDFTKRAPLREQVQAADLPELILVTTGGTSSLSSSSSSTRLSKRFDWVLTTGDMRLDEVMLPMSWALLEAMLLARANLFALQYHGIQYVKRVQEIQIREGESESTRRTNVRGWSVVQSVEVEMHFHTQTLLNAAQGL